MISREAIAADADRGRVRNEEEGQKLGGRKVNGGEAVLLEQRGEVGQVGEGFT